jgi:hypothetical protein
LPRGGIMERESLFRLALVSHDEAPATLRKYITILAKLSMYNTPKLEFSAAKITLIIQQLYELSFSESEISDALKFDSCFIYDNDRNVYYLSDRGIREIKEFGSPRLSLNKFIDDFFISLYPNSSEEIKKCIKEKINEYIYCSFVSGKETMLSLISCARVEFPQNIHFEATSEQKRIISEFLNWECSEKNQCIYEIISYCVDYGMITAKVDKKEYVKFFTGKSFILDTNVILRLIGLDNEEKQSIIAHFVSRCLDVNIELCYTNITYQEIMHTIPNIIKIIRGISAGDEPLSPQVLDVLGDYKYSDQYEMYYNWCKEKQDGNTDLDTFHQHLVKKVDDCLTNFKRIDIFNYELIQEKKKEFNTYVNSLMEFKNGRRHNRPIHIEPVKNDINNFVYVKLSNDEDKADCSKFIITADLGYYEWSRKLLPGVPLVFQPSEWLSIILKFTTRAESDYLSFSKFINLGYKIDDKTAERSTQIILSVNELTTDVEVKCKVLKQLAVTTMNELQDNFTENRKAVKAAYDEVKKQEKDEEIERLNKKFSNETKEKERQYQQEKKRVEKATQEETIKIIAKATIDKRFSRLRWVNKKIVIFDAISAVMSFLLLLLISNTALKDSILKLCNNQIMKGHEFEISILMCGTIVVLIIFILTSIFKYLCSDNRYARHIKKEEAKLKKQTFISLST